MHEISRDERNGLLTQLQRVLTQEQVSQLMPATRLTNVNECADPTLAKRQHGARRTTIELRDESHSWYLGKLAHHTSHTGHLIRILAECR